MQKYLWYVQGFLKKYKRTLTVSVVVGIAFFIVVPSIFSLLPIGKSTRYIGRVGSFPLSKLPRDIQEKVSFGLTRVEEDGNVVPALAASFRPEEENHAYRFVLRPQMLWQDGKTVTPQDVNYNFSDIDVVRSQNDIVYKSSIKQGSVKPEEAFLPSSFPSIVSLPLFRQEKKRSMFFFERNVIYGLGQYAITSISTSGPSIRQLTLETESERLVYRFYPTERDAITAFKHGDVDYLEDIQNIDELSEWGAALKKKTVHNDQYIGVFFNLAYEEDEDKPYSNRLLRQALNYAIQKPQGALRVLTPIHKESWAYVTNDLDVDAFDQDMNQAVDALRKAQLFAPRTIELTTIPSYTMLAESIKASWEKLGEMAIQKCKEEASSTPCENLGLRVLIRIRNVPDTADFQVMLVGQQIPRDPDQYSLWHSTQSTNFTHYKNARVDKLLEDARKTAVKEERKLLYQEFQRLLVKDSPVIFLSPIETYTVERQTLRNVLQ